MKRLICCLLFACGIARAQEKITITPVGVSSHAQDWQHTNLVRTAETRDISLSKVTTGTNMISGERFGIEAGDGATGVGNHYFGFQAGVNSSGGTNTYVGYQAGTNSGATESDFLGLLTGVSSTGTVNTYLGYYSGDRAGGSYSLYLGTGAGIQSLGDYNTYLGRYSGWLGKGRESTYIGYGSGYQSSLTNSIAFGDYAGALNTGERQVFIDAKSGWNPSSQNSTNDMIYGDDGYLHLGRGYGTGLGAGGALGVELRGPIQVSGTLTVDKYDSYQVPTALSIVTGSVTIARADGIDVSVDLTNNVTFYMAASDWNTNGVGRVAVGIKNANTHSLTFPAAQFDTNSLPTFDDDNPTTFYLRRGWQQSLWEIKQ